MLYLFPRKRGGQMYDKLLDVFNEYLDKQDALSNLSEHGNLHDYAYSEVHTLAAIGDLSQPNVTALARHMHMSKGAISKITKRLQTAGLIETYQLENNKQKVFFRLTPAGQLLYDEHHESHSRWMQRDREFFKRYDPEVIECITNFMVDFNAYLEEKIEELSGKTNAD